MTDELITVSKNEYETLQRKVVEQSQTKEKILDRLFRLIFFSVESKPLHFNPENDMYSEGDENCYFGSEGFLYPLLGKEDARTVKSLLTKLGEEICGSHNEYYDRFDEHLKKYIRYRVTIQFHNRETMLLFMKSMNSLIDADKDSYSPHFNKDSNILTLTGVSYNRLIFIDKSLNSTKYEYVVDWSDYLSRRNDEDYINSLDNQT